jgi:GNAT superfamily N-acetyltransferase
MSLGVLMSHNTIEILIASSAELSAVIELFQSIEKEYNPTDNQAPLRAVKGIKASRRAFDFLGSTSFWLLLARKDDRLTGYLTVVRIPKLDNRLGVLYIDELYVLSQYRRQGLGSALLEKVSEIGRQLSYWRVRLKADQTDESVCLFYERNGFTHSGDGFFEKNIA